MSFLMHLMLNDFESAVLRSLADRLKTSPAHIMRTALKDYQIALSADYPDFQVNDKGELK